MFQFLRVVGDNLSFSTPSTEYLPFGVGRHLWSVLFILGVRNDRLRVAIVVHSPGRIFTGVVMKVVMCHLILNYDVKQRMHPCHPHFASYVWST